MTIDEAKIKIEELACYARTKGWDDEYTEAVNMVLKALENQPTDAVDRVTIKEYLSSCEVPYQKIGTWRTVKHYVNYYQCTYCSREIADDHSRGWNYCPFCGAKMSDVEDKNET